MSGRSRIWAALNWPNRISLFRLLMVGPFVVLLINQGEDGYAWARRLALGIFVFMAMSDFVDGVLARRLNLRTRLGAILDPLADKVLIISAVVLLSVPSLSPGDYLLPIWLVVAVVGKDLWVMAGFLVVYLVTDKFRVRPTLAGKACTAGQLVLVAATLAAPDINRLCASAAGSLLAEGLTWAVGALVALSIISYTRLGLAFVASGQKPLDDHAGVKKDVVE